MPKAKGFFILNNMKTCTKCKVEKEFSEFYKDKNRKDNLCVQCKKCMKQYLNKLNRKEYSKQYYLGNKEHIKNKSKEYRLENLDKSKEYKKQYKLNNKEVINKYYRDRKLNDPLFKLSCNIRNLIGISIKGKGYSKKSKTYNILGCSLEEFKQHLENKFTDGMTWDNTGQWHIDHIYPVSLATDEEHLIKLNHYKNLQPLWAKDNIKKSNKI